MFKALRLTRVNEGPQQFYLPSTRLSTYGMSHPAFTALWLVLISRPAEDRRLSLPPWLCEILRWFAHEKTVTQPSTSC